MNQDLWIDELVKRTSAELRYVRSVDGFLVKLSTLLYDVSGECAGDSSCTRACFEKALRHPVLEKELSRLSCYKDVAFKMIAEDPRFKSLRNYIDVLRRALDETMCSGTEMDVYREATFRIEEEDVEKRTTVDAGLLPEPVKTRWYKIAAVAFIGVALVLLLLAVIMLIR